VNSGPMRVTTLHECRENDDTVHADLFCPGVM